MSLTLSSIAKNYGKKSVLQDVNITFEKGLNILLGPSGAGKTTLLRLCATVEKPTSGKMHWYEKPLRSKSYRRVLGYAPQALEFPEDLRARDFLTHIAALKGLSRTKPQIRNTMEHLGLSDDLDTRIGAFSGGMKRRLTLAQAILGNPEILIADEPTAELDAYSIERVTSIIEAYAQKALVIMTTHLADPFKRLDPNVYRIENGHVEPEN